MVNTEVKSFNSDGFTLLDNGGGSYDVNGAPGGTYSGDGRYVAWCWSAGDTTVINNDGDIPSQVRSNGEFSVIKYTGNLTANGSVTVGTGFR